MRLRAAYKWRPLFSLTHDVQDVHLRLHRLRVQLTCDVALMPSTFIPREVSNRVDGGNLLVSCSSGATSAWQQLSRERV